MENLNTADCIRTFTGLYMNVFEPTPQMICIEDIAHGLSNMPRFGGHLPDFYSVAQHSVSTAQMVPFEYKLQALLHDASEAYLMDIPSPIKRRLPEYQIIEANLMLVIAQKFGFRYPLNHVVKIADQEMLIKEWDTMMVGTEINPSFCCLTPSDAKKRFLDEYSAIMYIHSLNGVVRAEDLIN